MGDLLLKTYLKNKYSVLYSLGRVRTVKVELDGSVETIRSERVDIGEKCADRIRMHLLGSMYEAILVDDFDTSVRISFLYSVNEYKYRACSVHPGIETEIWNGQFALPILSRRALLAKVLSEVGHYAPR